MDTVFPYRGTCNVGMILIAYIVVIIIYCLKIKHQTNIFVFVTSISSYVIVGMSILINLYNCILKSGRNYVCPFHA